MSCWLGNRYQSLHTTDEANIFSEDTPITEVKDRGGIGFGWIGERKVDFHATSGALWFCLFVCKSPPAP